MAEINYPVAAATYVYRNAGSTSNPSQLSKIEQMLRDNSDLAYSISRTPEYNFFLSAGIGSMEPANKQKRPSMNEMVDKADRETNDVAPKAKKNADDAASRAGPKDIPQDQQPVDNGSSGDEAPSPSSAAPTDDGQDDFNTLGRLLGAVGGVVSKRPAASTARSVMRNETKPQRAAAADEGSPAVAELVDEGDDDITTLDALQSPDDQMRIGRGPAAIEDGAEPAAAIGEEKKLEDLRPKQEGKITRGTPGRELKTEEYTIRQNQDGTGELEVYGSGQRIPLQRVVYQGTPFYYYGSFVFSGLNGQLVKNKSMAQQVLDFVDREQ